MYCHYIFSSKINKAVAEYFHSKKTPEQPAENRDDPKNKEHSTTHEEDIFTKELKPMRCLAILIQNLRAQISTSLESEMTKESRIKGEEQLNELKKATKISSDNFADYK